MKTEFGYDWGQLAVDLKKLWYQVKEPVPAGSPTGGGNTPAQGLENPWLYVGVGGVLALALGIFKRKKR